MVKNSYARTCNEVYEVLKLTPKEQIKLIPEEVIKEIKLNANKNNEKINLDFDEMGNVILSNEAKAMIVAIYKNYFLKKDDQRIILNKQLQKNENIKEIEKESKYQNYNDPFYRKKEESFNQGISNGDNIKIEEIKCDHLQVSDSLININQKNGLLQKMKEIFNSIKKRIFKM